MGGMAAVLPFAITTALRATSVSAPTWTVRRSTNVPSPRKSFAPVASSAAAGRESSRSRAIQSTRLDTFGKSTSHSTRDAARMRARPASSRVSPERSSVFDGMHPQYGHSPPTSSRSTTASESPLPCRPPAIASPATPPPRQTTSNSCGNLLPSINACPSQRFQQRSRRESPHVALAVVNGRMLRGAGERGGEGLAQRARERHPWLVLARLQLAPLERLRIDLDDRHPAHQPFAAEELRDVLARRPGEDPLRSVVLRDLRLHLEQADPISDQHGFVDVVRHEDDRFAH